MQPTEPHMDANAPLQHGVLFDQAEALLAGLETGDTPKVMQIIENMNRYRDEALFNEIGQLTRSLHNSIQSFHIYIASHYSIQQLYHQHSKKEDCCQLVH